MAALFSPIESLQKIRNIRENPTHLCRGEKPDAEKISNNPATIILEIFAACGLFLFFGGISWVIAFFIMNDDPYSTPSYSDPFYNHPLAFGVVMGIIITAWIITLDLRRKKRIRGAVLNNKIRTQIPKTEFGLYLGQSTGKFSNLWHDASIAPHQDIILNLKDAAQNILTLGAIGSGKTSRVMRPLLLQLFDQKCGGLIFDIKGDVQQTAQNFANITGHTLKIIGVKQSKINLLAGLTPEIAASFLQSAFLLNHSGKLDGFWIQTAGELCRNSLGVLFHFPEYYNLESLFAYLFDKNFKDEIDGKIYQLLPTLETGKQRILKSYCRYDESIFSAFDEKVKSGVKATVAQVLSPFSHPDLIDAFCTSNEATLNIQDILDGTTYLVDLPLATWGFGGKVIYTFIKLRFFNLMQNRQLNPEWNQDRPVFFMCDEYQEIVSANKDGLSDLNFWDKARTSNTIGIISGQSVSSFEAVIGDTRLTSALLQNFRQKICFKTEDEVTLRLLNEIAGQATTTRYVHSYTDSSTSAGTTSSSTSSSSTTTTKQKESVIDAQLLRGLPPNQSIALLSINEHSMDDVLEMLPVTAN